MKSALRIAAAVIVLSFVGLFAWAKVGNWIHPDTERIAAAMSVEEKFVTVSTGQIPGPGDAMVARTRQLLDMAVMEYGANRELIADQAYSASKIAADHGMKVTALEVLEATVVAHQDGAPPDFPKMAGSYLTLRKSGMDHGRATMALKDLVSGYYRAAGKAAP